MFLCRRENGQVPFYLLIAFVKNVGAVNGIAALCCNQQLMQFSMHDVHKCQKSFNSVTAVNFVSWGSDSNIQ